MRVFFSGLLAAWLLVLATVVGAQTKTITIAAEDDWAPYSSRKADGSGPEGFSPDLVRAVFKLKGVDVRFVVVPFVRCLYLVKVGEAVACFNTTVTDENRDEFIWHPTPIFHEGLSIFTRSQNPASGLNTAMLEGKTVGITKGYTYPTDFMRNNKIRKFEANSDDHLLKMLLAKRVDYVILNTVPGLLRIRQDAQASGKVKLAGEISNDGFWLNFSKAHPDGKPMAELFEAGLQDFKKSGAYAKLQSSFRSRLGLPH